MILHDVCTVQIIEKLDQYDPNDPRETVPQSIPCEINPIETEPANASGPVVTRYRLVTTVDLIALVDAQLAEWEVDFVDLVLTYDGKTLQPEAGFERHKILGRFHHIEAVMKDFGFTGA